MPEDIIVGDRITFGNQFRIPSVSNLRCSWEISRIGLLSCDIPLADLPARAVPVKNLIRKWVSYQHPTAGVWGGVISSAAVRDGIVTLDCESWAAMFRGVMTSGLTAVTVANGIHQAIANAQPQTGISFGSFTWPSADEADRYPTADILPGAPFFANGQDLYEGFLAAVIDRLEAEHGWKSSLRTIGWNINPETRQFYLDMTFGRNLTQTVALRDRVHNVASGWNDDVEDIANTLLLSATYGYQSYEQTGESGPQWFQTDPGGYCVRWGNKKPNGNRPCVEWAPEQGYWATTPIYGTVPQTTKGTVMAVNQESVNRYGPITLQIESPTAFSSLSELQQTAQLYVKALSRNEQLVTIECADEGGIWSKFREGDIIGVDLSNSGRTGNMVVRTRALDTTRGVMYVSGEAELT